MKDGSIEMSVDGARVHIDVRGGKVLSYQVTGAPSKELRKAVNELSSAGVGLKTAVQMLTQQMYK